MHPKGRPFQTLCKSKEIQWGPKGALRKIDENRWNPNQSKGVPLAKGCRSKEIQWHPKGYHLQHDANPNWSDDLLRGTPCKSVAKQSEIKEHPSAMEVQRSNWNRWWFMKCVIFWEYGVSRHPRGTPRGNVLKFSCLFCIYSCPSTSESIFLDTRVYLWDFLSIFLAISSISVSIRVYCFTVSISS